MAIIDALKYDGPNNVLVWTWRPRKLSEEHEELDSNQIDYDIREEVFRFGMQIVVNHSQQAVFVKNGKIVGVFESGRYTLSEKNIGLPFGSESSFKAELFYINQAVTMNTVFELKPFNMIEPNYRIPVPVISRGSFAVKVSDTKLFLNKLLRTVTDLEADTLTSYFNRIITERVKSSITQIARQKNLSPFELESIVFDVSTAAKDYIANTFAKFGLQIELFNIEEISIVTNDPRVEKIVDDGFDESEETAFNLVNQIANNVTQQSQMQTQPTQNTQTIKDISKDEVSEKLQKLGEFKIAGISAEKEFAEQKAETLRLAKEKADAEKKSEEMRLEKLREEAVKKAEEALKNSIEFSEEKNDEEFKEKGIMDDFRKENIAEKGNNVSVNTAENLFLFGYYFKCLLIYFNGRARRREYWGFTLFNMIFSFGCFLVEMLFAMNGYKGIGLVIYCLYYFAVFIPGTSVTVRRLHDVGKSGWNYLWCFTIIGAIPVLIWLCKDSEHGENKYGVNPKGN